MFSLTSTSELLSVLDAAERLLAATGYAVTLCPNYGVASARNPGPDHPSPRNAQGVGA